MMADICVFDPDSETDVNDSKIYSRWPSVSIYNGKKLNGVIRATFLRGKLIYRNDEADIFEKQGPFGKILRKSEFILQ